MHEQSISPIHYEQLLQTVGFLANDGKINLHLQQNYATHIHCSSLPPAHWITETL